MGGEDMTDIREHLLRLFRDAEAKTEACLFPGEAEPEMAAFIADVRRHPEEREYVGQIFRNAMDTPGMRWEFLAFCFHSLRWPEIRDEVIARLERDRDNVRTRPFWADLRDSFDDGWEDADLFREFSNPRNAG